MYQGIILIGRTHQSGTSKGGVFVGMINMILCIHKLNESGPTPSEDMVFILWIDTHRIEINYRMSGFFLQVIRIDGPCFFSWQQHLYTSRQILFFQHGVATSYRIEFAVMETYKSKIIVGWSTGVECLYGSK